VALRVPRGVICLISALAFHDLTTQIPHEVSVAIPRGAEKPRMDHPPVRFYRFSEAAFATGVETHELDGVEVRIYSPEKTVADCFKYRNKIGLNVALEALKSWRERKGANPDVLLEMAKVCRVESVLRPYLLAIL
jgi:predicted transcriptional regulator of viral defense system